MKSQHGFTLVEALVAGIISVIIPAVIIAMLSANNVQLLDNSSHSHQIQVFNLVSEDIERSVRQAARAVQGGSCATGPVASAPNSVVLCAANTNALIKGYRATASAFTGVQKLQEWGPADAAWKTFKIGSDSVLLLDPDMGVNANRKVSGYFNVYPASVGPPAYAGGEGLRFNLVLVTKTSGNTWDTLAFQTESMICRNVTAW